MPRNRGGEGKSKMTFPTVKWVDWVLARIRALLSVKLIHTLDRWLVLIGGYGAYALILLAAVTLLVVGIRLGSAELIIGGLLVIPGGVLLQYLSTKMLDSVGRLIDSTSTEITSRGFLEVVAVVFVILAVALPIIGIVQAIEELSLIPLASYIGLGLLFAYSSAIALNSSLVNVHVSPTASIGQEAIGITTFFIKALYRFTPVAFGVLVVVFAVYWLQLLIESFGAGVGAVAFVAVILILYSAAALVWPLVAYLFFIVTYLVIDVLRAILTAGQVAHQYRKAEPQAALPTDQAAGGTATSDGASPQEGSTPSA
jgi:hypothetical protein